MKIAEHALPEAFAARLSNLPIMPEAAHKALEMVRDPDACLDELGRVISMDAALTASILRFANSAWFGFRKSVSTIPHAIVLLGLGRLRTLILSSVVKGMSSQVPDVGKEHCFELWNQAVRTAAAARRIAEKRAFDWEEEAFVAGLLHNCGREVFLMLETERYIALGAAGEQGGFPTPEEEMREFGFSHSDVGAALLRMWKLPNELVLSTRSHHDLSPETLKSPFRAALNLAVYLARTPPGRIEALPALLASLKLDSEPALGALCDAVLERLPLDTARLLDATY